MSSVRPSMFCLTSLIGSVVLITTSQAQVQLPSYQAPPGSGAGQIIRTVGDVNQDEIPDVLIGAPLENSFGTGSGAAYLLSGHDLSVLRRLGGIQTNEHLGASVTGVGDLNGDGYADYAIGASGNPNSAGVPASVTVYDGFSGTPGLRFNGLGSEPAYGIATNLYASPLILVGHPDPLSDLAHVTMLNASNGSRGTELVQPSLLHAEFGRTLAGPLHNANGTAVAFAVGAALYPEDPTLAAYRRGWVQVYAENGTPLWTATGDRARDHFGAAITTIGDLDGDGWNELLVGAPAPETTLTDERGFARILDGRSGFELYTLRGAAADDQFGSAVTSLGDLNGDSASEFAIAARSGGAHGRGYVRVYSGVGAALLYTFDAPSTAQGFATSITGGGALTLGQSDLFFSDVTTGVVEGLSWAKYPGSASADELLLEFGAFRDASRDGVQAVWGGEPSYLQLRSPNATRNGAPFVVMLQLFATGQGTGSTPFYPELQIDITQSNTYATLGAGVLTPQGWNWPSTAARGVGGLSALFQGIVFDPSFAPRNLVTTQAIEVLHRPRPTLYVASNGSSSNTGFDAAHPLASIADAIARARAMGNPTTFTPYPLIRVAAGVYNETPLIDRPISIIGGCDPQQNWDRPQGSYTQLRTTHRGMRIEGVTTATRFVGLELQASNGLLANANGPFDEEMASIALRVNTSSSAVRFDDCIFRSGRGADGRDGASSSFNPADGSPGSSGASGYYTLSTNSSPAGGAAGNGGAGWNDGGRGGNGGRMTCTNSIGSICLTARANGGSGGASAPNCNNGVSGGGRGVCNSAGDGTDGAPGGPGASGANGDVPANARGTINSSGRWFPLRSGGGSNGADGCGGSGGGGGGAVECAQQFAAGASGGGGGGGGQGGRPGLGGMQGGASFAALLHNASPTFTRCVFSSNQGGTGGRGGNGSAGGDGAAGGGGGSGFNGTIGGFGLGSGDGGDGGDGGAGGGGGGGGGANGGPSFAVFLSGTSAPPALQSASAANQLSAGAGGTGGTGGAQGNTGVRAPNGNPGASGQLGQ